MKINFFLSKANIKHDAFMIYAALETTLLHPAQGYCST
jgi:hypothetical protein